MRCDWLLEASSACDRAARVTHARAVPCRAVPCRAVPCMQLRGTAAAAHSSSHVPDDACIVQGVSSPVNGTLLTHQREMKRWTLCVRTIQMETSGRVFQLQVLALKYRCTT
jgi:hypothetical protein